jgi:hypothetical protein
MYSARLMIFAAIATTILTSLPAANLGLRAYVGGTLWPKEVRDLWSVDRIEGNLGYLAMTCCDRSLFPGQVQIGQQGYLFLGDDDDDVMSKATGGWPVPDGLIDDVAARLARLKADVAAAGGVLATAIAPNKHSIYPEMLPIGMTAAARTATDDLLDAAEAKGVQILDLRPDMRQLKKTSQAYLKTDTHWTNAGGAAAYDAMMARLREQYGIDAAPVKYTLNEVRTGAGDLARLLKMQSNYSDEHETNYWISLETRPETCIARVSLVAQDVGACVPGRDDDVSVRESAIRQAHTPGAPNSQTVLMLCDSFCHATSPLFDATFETVYRVHWKFLDGDALRRFVADVQPDIVILQMVERSALSYGEGTR